MENIVAGKTKEKESHDEAITYAWLEDATYETLNVDIITTSEQT